MTDETTIAASEDTGKFYRLEFYKERAEVAVEVAKILHARTLNGNRLIPLEAFGKDKTSKDTLGNGGNMGFTPKASKLNNGYAVEMLKNGMAFEDMAKDPGTLHIIDKKEVDQWAIQITVPANLSRDGIVAAFGQSFGKALTKEQFVRKKGGAEGGVPLHKITVSLSTLINAPDLKLATTPDGDMMMVDPQQLMAEAEAARARRMIGDGRSDGGNQAMGRGGR